MIFVDTNVWMYAVGGPHPLRDQARRRLGELVVAGTRMVSSAEVLQELMHAYLPVGRLDTLDAALRLATDLAEIVPLTEADVALARDMVATEGTLSARDLIHLATALRHQVDEVLTFDRALAAAFSAK